MYDRNRRRGSTHLLLTKNPEIGGFAGGGVQRLRVGTRSRAQSPDGTESDVCTAPYALGMQTTYDPEADAAYIMLVPEIADGRSVRNEEIQTAGGSVILDFDVDGVLLGVEVLGASAVLDPALIASAVRDG